LHILLYTIFKKQIIATRRIIYIVIRNIYWYIGYIIWNEKQA